MPGTPKIIVLSEQLRGQSFELTEEQYTVGRSEECSICIPDPTISSNHCSFVRSEGGTYRVVDNGSTNGTRVNGVRVQSQELVNSDILQIGGVEMLFDCDEKSVTSVLSTQTGINLEDTAGGMEVSEMKNFSPFGSTSPATRQDSKRIVWVFVAVIGALAIAVVVLLVMLLGKLFL
jgi:pSer/pThr/pTyr-binding forkhead associated (FHA) protein